MSTVSDEWNLTCFPQMQRYLSIIDDPCNLRNATKVIQLFKEHVSPKLASFRTGIIHADVNGLNVIVKKQRSSCDEVYHVAGLIDFSDSIHTCIVFELAISAAHMMGDNLPHFDSVAAAVELVGPLVGAYNSILPLAEDEFDSLYYLVLARCVLVAINGTRHQKEDSSNSVFSEHRVWTLVDELLNFTKVKVDTIWKKYITGSWR